MKIPHRAVRAKRPPLILLGGTANSLSIARSLARDGVMVYAIAGPESPIRHSRYVRWIRLSGTDEAAWQRYLLTSESDLLRGSVLLAGSDDAIEFLALHRAGLGERFLLDDSDPVAQLCMLDKLLTYERARQANVPTPRFWPIESVSQLLALRSELSFPLIVKPRRSHLFQARFGRKWFFARSFEELEASVAEAAAAGLDMMLVEMIPGPDDLLCSYYTYLDEGSQPLFHFTKRVIRRYPASIGMATYHVTDHIPELRELSVALFQEVGLRGLANAEFKLDLRDGKYKLIECNARFTAANLLLIRAGFDLGRWVYYRIIGLPYRALGTYPAGLRLWSPVEDFRAFLALRASGELTARGWISGLLHRQTFPLFDWRDPLPSLVAHGRQIRGAANKVHRPLRKIP